MYKEKLIDLLKSDEQTKQSIEKIEFGTQIKLKCYIEPKKITLGKDISYNEFQVMFTLDNQGKWFNRNDIGKIIGLPLQERFIRMYLKNILNDFNLYKANFIYQKIYIEIDNTKDFDNQDDEVYQKIYEALLKPYIKPAILKLNK